MNGSVKKIIVGVMVGILVCACVFFAYEKGYKAKPFRFDPEKVQYIGVVDFKSGYAATIYEKDKIKDALKILGNMKTHQSLSSVDDINAMEPGAVITISTTEEKKKKKTNTNSQTENPLTALGEAMGLDMPAVYTIYGNNVFSYDDERVYSIKTSDYEKITEVCQKYGEQDEMYQNLFNGLSGLNDAFDS